MSAGVFIQIRIFRHSTQTTAVITTAKIRASQPPLATNRRSATSFFSPNFCATGIAKPLHTPTQNPIIIKLIEPVDPTAASAFTPRYLPTIMVSTILYSC